MVVFWQKWLYSGKSGSNPAKVVAFEQSGCIRQKVLYSAKVFGFGQKWLYLGKVFVFG